jgi:hypothetical protein
MPAPPLPTRIHAHGGIFIAAESGSDSLRAPGSRNVQPLTLRLIMMATIPARRAEQYGCLPYPWYLRRWFFTLSDVPLYQQSLTPQSTQLPAVTASWMTERPGP